MSLYRRGWYEGGRQGEGDRRGQVIQALKCLNICMTLGKQCKINTLWELPAEENT